MTRDVCHQAAVSQAPGPSPGPSVQKGLSTSASSFCRFLGIILAGILLGPPCHQLRLRLCSLYFTNTRFPDVTMIWWQRCAAFPHAVNISVEQQGEILWLTCQARNGYKVFSKPNLENSLTVNLVMYLRYSKTYPFYIDLKEKLYSCWQ